MTEGYAWNGCRPKVCVFDFLLGTPEGVVYAKTGRRKTYFASLVHDALYQFLPEDLPYRRRDADRFFLVLLGDSEFAPRWPYSAAVRLFAGSSSERRTEASDARHPGSGWDRLRPMTRPRTLAAPRTSSY